MGGFVYDGKTILKNTPEIKYRYCYKDSKPINANYTGNAGYRVPYGNPTTFNNFPTDYEKILTVIPTGTYSLNDSSYTGPLSYILAIDENGNNLLSATLWGECEGNTTHRAQIVVVYI